MRTHAMATILSVAATIGHLVTANYIVDVAVRHNYSYDDYVLLCKCLARVPMAEAKLLTQKQEHLQLTLEGIT